LSTFGVCTIQVTFTPTAGGARNGSLTVNLGSSAPSLTANLSGQGRVVVASASPTSLSFGNQLLGATSAAQTVTVTGDGTATPLQISSVSITGDYAQTSACFGLPVALPNCMVSVTFSPTALGSRPGTMVINTNQGSFPIALDGAGIAPFAQLSATSLDFGNQLVNSTSSPQTVTLSNTGGATLQITSINASGDFAQTNTCGALLAPGAGCTINIIFKPVARGSRTGTLTVGSNTFGPAPVVSLSGT